MEGEVWVLEGGKAALIRIETCLVGVSPFKSKSKSKSKFRPSGVGASQPGFQPNRQARQAKFAEKKPER